MVYGDGRADAATSYTKAFAAVQHDKQDAGTGAIRNVAAVREAGRSVCT